MHVTLVHLHIKQDRLESFLQALADNQAASMQEDGNLRFDVLQDVNDPSRIIIYEAYNSAASAAAHKETAHYLAYVERTQDCFASPRDPRPMTALWLGPVVDH